MRNIVSGAVTNYGWHFERDGVGNDSAYRAFNSSTDTDGSRPELVVAYTPANATVTSVNEGSQVPDGATGIAFTYSGFASEPTSAKIVDDFGGEHALTSFSAAGGNGTVDWQDVSGLISNTAGCALTSAVNSVEFQLTDGTETAAIDVVYRSKTGEALISHAVSYTHLRAHETDS